MGSGLTEKILKFSRAKSGARMLLLVLAHRADEATGECWPSVARLAVDCGMLDRQVRRNLAELVGLGEVERIESPGKANRYRITTPVLHDTPVVHDSPVLEDRQPLSCRTETPVVQDSHNTKNTKRTLNVCASTDSFARFWGAYPKRKSKVAAEAVWHKLKPSAELIETMLAAIEVQKQSHEWLKDGGKWIPYPERWLKKRRWEDQIEVDMLPRAEVTADILAVAFGEETAS